MQCCCWRFGSRYRLVAGGSLLHLAAAAEARGARRCLRNRGSPHAGMVRIHRPRARRPSVPRPSNRHAVFRPLNRLLHPLPYPFSPLVDSAVNGFDYLAVAGILLAFVIVFPLARKTGFNPADGR